MAQTRMASPTAPIQPFFAIPTPKLLVMVLATGVYGTYWFYASWKHIGRAEGRPMYPLGKTIMTTVAIYHLTARIADARGTAGGKRAVLCILAPTLFLILTYLGVLPGVGGLTGLVAVIPLAYIQIEAASANSVLAGAPYTRPTYSRYDVLALLIFAPMNALAWAAAFGLLPDA